MSADILTLDRSLRARFAASISATPDEINLRAAVEDRRTELNAILFKLQCIKAAERKPGYGTAQAMEIVARRLFAMARELRLAQPVDRPCDTESA